MLQENERNKMKSKTARLSFNSKGIAKLLTGGDWHRGTEACHEGGIRKFLESAKRHMWIGMADMVEAIIPGDKRFAIDEHGMASLMGQLKKTSELIRSSAETCIGIVAGNHEGAPSRIIGSLSRAMADYAVVPYLTQTAFITFDGALAPIKGFFAHGKLTFNSKAGEYERVKLNREIRLRDYLSCFEADIKVVGHGHRFVCARPVEKLKMQQTSKLEVKRVPIPIKSGWCVMCPAMAMVYAENCETYAESLLVDPADLGWVEYIIHRKNGVVAVNHINEDGKIVRTVEREVLA